MKITEKGREARRSVEETTSTILRLIRKMMKKPTKSVMTVRMMVLTMLRKKTMRMRKMSLSRSERLLRKRRGGRS